MRFYLAPIFVAMLALTFVHSASAACDGRAQNSTCPEPESIEIQWRRMCSNFSRDWGVHMNHGVKQESPIHLLLAPNFGEDWDAAKASPDAIVIPLEAQSWKNGEWYYPELLERKYRFSVDGGALDRLLENHRARGLQLLVINLRGLVIGSSSVLPDEVRYDPDQVRKGKGWDKKRMRFFVSLGFLAGIKEGEASEFVSMLRSYCDHTMTPLALSFDGVMPDFRAAADGVGFRLLAEQEGKLSWPKANHADFAWLARDLNGNGRIDDGGELFGESRPATGVRIATNGFASLATLDQNFDGRVSGTELAGLSLWFDRDGNGLSDAGELVPASARIKSIGLGYRAEDFWSDRHGNYVPLVSTAVTVEGKAAAVWDIYLATEAK